MLRLLAIFVTLMFSVTGAYAQHRVPATPYFMDLDIVYKIVCSSGGRGTGFAVDHNKLVTAAHVVRDQGSCHVNGRPVTVVHIDAATDIAIVSVAVENTRRFKLSCAGFTPEKSYVGAGYAQGTDFVAQRVMGTDTFAKGDKFGGMRILTGHFYRGMSGGPVVDENGVVVGIVSGGPILPFIPEALSRELKTTHLCAKPA